jgi:ABC-type multidrug transport system fused ATPase/permease subunit
LDLKILRKKLILIPQEPTLFHDTLKVNLDPEGHTPDEKLWRILEKIGLKEKFEEREGLETEITERGENLSAGEK